jgi:hypothetical protein
MTLLHIGAFTFYEFFEKDGAALTPIFPTGHPLSHRVHQLEGSVPHKSCDSKCKRSTCWATGPFVIEPPEIPARPR